MLWGLWVGVLGLCKGKYLYKVKLDNYNSSEVGVSRYKEPFEGGLGTLEYIGNSREILEVYDVESIVDQIVQDYSHVQFGFEIPGNKYIFIKQSPKETPEFIRWEEFGFFFNV